MYNLIESQNKYGKLINLSGKQRMLSQRTAYFSHLVLYHHKPLEELKPLIREMRNDYRFISTNLPSEQLRRYYLGEDGLEMHVVRYFKLLDAFAAHPEHEYLHPIEAASDTLLTKLDQAVSLFEQENQAIVDTLQQRELMIFIGTLLTLVLEALFIVRPMIRTHRQYLQQLEAEVEKKTREIQLFARIFEDSKEGIIITDSNERIINVNLAFETISGYKKEDVLGQTPRILDSGKHDSLFFARMWSVLTQTGRWQGQIVNKRKNGELFPVQITITRMAYRDENHYVSVFTDISERMQQMQKLNHVSSHDSLTGLLNRNAILNHINRAIKLADRTHKYLAIAFLDLDNFKMINDSIGHAEGDAVLQEFAQRLSGQTKHSDMIGRLGGDEFVVVFEALDRPGEEHDNLKRFFEIVEMPFQGEKGDLFVGLSIGVTYYPSPSTKGEVTGRKLVREADLAMGMAKKAGKERIAHYSEEIGRSITSKIATEHGIRDALERQELELYLQPKIDVASRRIVSAETLLRWNHDGEVVPPDKFIPLAEESGLIKEIDCWVAEESVRLLGVIHDAGHSHFRIAFNLSGRSFSDKSIIDRILGIIYRSGKAAYMEVEITEGVLIENILFAATVIKKIKSMGVTVALDDFGIGYSSFYYLDYIPFDVIKIDRSFVEKLDNPKKQILVKAIIQFSHQLGMNVVAEGVETREQFAWLTEKKCDRVQGYFFSRPVPLEQFETLLRQ